eukprot:9487895-Pyramimonas_sp.AAC.3
MRGVRRMTTVLRYSARGRDAFRSALLLRTLRAALDRMYTYPLSGVRRQRHGLASHATLPLSSSR